MSGPAADKLSQEKIQQLLAAVGSVSPSDAGGDIDAPAYDWRKPRYFNLGQLAKLEAFTVKTAEECVEGFSRLYQGDVTVSVVSTEQCFWDPSETEAEQSDYYAAFGVDPQKPFGLIRIPGSSAATWTGQVLGADELTKDSGQTLSKLEESFLLDIVSGLIKDFSRAYGSSVQFDRRIIRDPSLIGLQGSEELFKIAFEVRKADSEKDAAQALFLICCDKLRSVVGKNAADEGKAAAPADNARAMREYIHGIPVSLTVQLAKTTLLFKDVMDLQVNDIMLLNKKVSDPVEILLEDETLFRGRPAQSGGKHAVVIV